MGLHHFPQDSISSRRGVITKLLRSQQINAICQKLLRTGSRAKPMNPKGENLGTSGLECMKGSLAEPSEVGLNFDT